MLRRLGTLVFISLFWSLPLAAKNAAPLRFRITLGSEAAQKAASGRLFVLMTNATQPSQLLEIGFIPGSTWIAAVEIEHIKPGATVDFDPDANAYPQPFSQAKPGKYQVMALLDQNHSYAYHGSDEGDLVSAVMTVEDLTTTTKPIELTLSRALPGRPQPADTDSIKLVQFQSPLLTRFWGRPITMRAGVVLPPSYGKGGTRQYPTAYHIHGFGGDHTGAWRQGVALVKEMEAGKSAEMVHVFLDGSFPTGHHAFADSVNNGPWGRALTEEFIPHLEGQFRQIAQARGRFLTGHSSGGWSTLWLQVTYPDFFGGTWSTAPDPVDLRNFTGINATVGSTDNAYREPDGSPKQLVRRAGKWLASIEQFARQEAVTGEYGGQFSSFEWVWSPRGADGRPLKLFNRQSGELNPEVLQYWQNYDIRLILAKNWTTLGPKLSGKLNIICGDADTFRLNEAVVMLCDFLREEGSRAVCELVPGRDHGDLYQPYQTYPDGLAARINKEMAAKWSQARMHPRAR